MCVVSPCSTCAVALQVKISDFGMSRRVEDYYKSTRQGKWPLKWYAPECIEFSKFTSQSDVWSFAVTAWECMTFGKKPFKGWTGQMVVQNVILERKRLPSPPKCPGPLFDLMKCCWSHEPQHRPRFHDMVSQIATMKQTIVGGKPAQYKASAQVCSLSAWQHPECRARTQLEHVHQNHGMVFVPIHTTATRMQGSFALRHGCFLPHAHHRAHECHGPLY